MSKRTGTKAGTWVTVIHFGFGLVGLSFLSAGVVFARALGGRILSDFSKNHSRIITQEEGHCKDGCNIDQHSLEGSGILLPGVCGMLPSFL